jgi:cytochrome P450
MDVELDNPLGTSHEIERGPIFDFDFYADPQLSAQGDHLGVFARLSEAPPIFWSPACGGYWVIGSHALAYEAAHATDLFSSRSMNIPRDDTELDKRPAIPIMLDPPLHAHYREPLAKLFGPQRMARMESKIRQLAVELIDAVKDDGGCDFVKAVAEPLPVLTFMDLMGMDPTRLREFRELAIVGSVHPDPAVRKAGSVRVTEVMAAFVDERIANPIVGAEDITAQLIALQIDGRPITTEEVKAYCQLLFFAGLDTVVNSMAFGISYLARHPEMQARARGDLSNIKQVVEELLRLGTPAMPGRMVTRDETWPGVHLRKGDRAMLELPAANLDASVFPEPLVCNPDRPAITHLAFNSGPHRCVGQHLARIELKVMYEEWLRRVPAFRLDPAGAASMHGGMTMGIDALTLIW